ncbi:uncharacterized [Tachysurus ichikawai]
MLLRTKNNENIITIIIIIIIRPSVCLIPGVNVFLSKEARVPSASPSAQSRLVLPERSRSFTVRLRSYLPGAVAVAASRDVYVL